MIYSLKIVKLNRGGLKRLFLKKRLNNYKYMPLKNMNSKSEGLEIRKHSNFIAGKFRIYPFVNDKSKPKFFQYMKPKFKKFKTLKFIGHKINKSKKYQPINYKINKPDTFQFTSHKFNRSRDYKINKPDTFQFTNHKFNKYGQVNFRYNNYYRIKKPRPETHFLNFTEKWIDRLVIKKAYNLSDMIETNQPIILFWFIYLFNLFNFLLPNIIIKKLLDLINVYLYHDVNKHYYYFKLITLYSYKKFNHLMYDDLIEDKNINDFLNHLVFSFSYNDFFFKKKIIQLYQNFSLKLTNKSFRFHFLLNLARKPYRRRLRIKKLLRRRRRRLYTRFNLKSLRKFSKHRFTRKKYFPRRKFKKGKLVIRKRIKKRRVFRMRLLV